MYQTFTDITDAPPAIVVQNLVAGTSTTWQFATDAPEISDGLSWSPDSRSLAFQSETLVNRAWNQSARVDRPLKPEQITRRHSAYLAAALSCADALGLSRAPGRDMLWAGLPSASEGIGTCHHAGLTPAR